MRQLLYLIVGIFLLSGCQTQKDRLAKVWFFSSEIPDIKVEVAGQRSLSEEQYLFSRASFLNLQPDGRYTGFFNSFEEGEWQLKNGTIILINSRRKVSEFHLDSLQKDNLVCTYKGVPCRLVGFPNGFKAPADNPFTRENNLWRIRAEHKESDAEIAARLRNHFRYWEKYFSWGLDMETNVLDVRSLPGPLKLYGNGFELLHHQLQPTAWKTCFYDEADSWKAYEKMYYLLNREDIDWPKTENRFERFVSAFQQLQRLVK